MSGEVVRNAVIDKENAPETIADFDRAEIRRGEGLVLISGEDERKVGHVGEFALDLLVELGLAKEESLEEVSPAAQAVIDRLNNDLDELRTEVASLRREVKESKTSLEEKLQEAFGDKWVPRKKMPVRVAFEDKTESGWTAISEPFQDEEGEWLIKVSDGENIEYVTLDEVSEADTTPPSRPADPSKRLGWRQRIDDWTSLRRPVTYIQTRRPVGGGEVIEEEVTEERTNPAAVVAGLIGAAVLGGVIAWELKGTGHSHTKEFHTIINQNNHLKTEVQNMHKTLNQDSKIIGQNHNLLVHDAKTINENHRILKHNRAVLKHLHEQVHHLFKIEKGEGVREHARGSGTFTDTLSFRGDNPWHEVSSDLRERLGRSATAGQVRKATDYVLRINGLRWNGGGFGVDSHRLPLGFRFRVPRNIVEIANR